MQKGTREKRPGDVGLLKFPKSFAHFCTTHFLLQAA